MSRRREDVPERDVREGEEEEGGLKRAAALFLTEPRGRIHSLE